MNAPRITGRLLPLLLVTASLTTIGSLDAQEARRGGETPDEGARVVVYTLKNSHPDEVASVLVSLFSSNLAATTSGRTPIQTRITRDERTGSVIVLAGESVHRHIRELVDQLDRKVEGDAPRQETRIIRPKHISIDQLTHVMNMHRLSTALDRATNAVIVRGESREIEELEQTIAALDIESATLQLECWLLEHDKGRPVDQDSDLSALATELARNGLEKYGIFSHTSVRSLAGRQFSSQQSFQNRRLRHLSLKGELRLADGGRTVQIEIGLQTQLELSSGAESGPTDASGSFSLETVLETQPGKLVVIGLAPTGDETTRPLVLVLRVGG